MKLEVTGSMDHFSETDPSREHFIVSASSLIASARQRMEKRVRVLLNLKNILYEIIMSRSIPKIGERGIGS